MQCGQVVGEEMYDNYFTVDLIGSDSPRSNTFVKQFKLSSDEFEVHFGKFDQVQLVNHKIGVRVLTYRSEVDFSSPKQCLHDFWVALAQHLLHSGVIEVFTSHLHLYAYKQGHEDGTRTVQEKIQNALTSPGIPIEDWFARYNPDQEEK